MASERTGAATAGYLDGVRAVAPLLLGVVPFALVAGVSAVSAGLGETGAVLWSVVVFAGASQLAAFDLLRAEAPLVAVVVTALVINARFVLYSTSLAPPMAVLSRRRRCLAAYLLTDQVYAVSVLRFAEPLDARGRWRFYLGGSLVMWVTWQVFTLVGAVVGGAVPEQVPLEFAVPLAFLALLVPNVTDRPTLVAALVAGLVAVLAVPLGGARVPLAAVCGIAVGAAFGLWRRRGEPSADADPQPSADAEPQP